MKKIFYIVLVTICTMLHAQNVGIGTNTPHSSAALDVDVSSLPSNNKKGILLPRVSLLNNTDIVTIQNPASGLVVYNLVDNAIGTVGAVEKDTFYFWNGVRWTDITTIDVIREELLPQVFFLIGSQSQDTTGSTPNITTGVVVNYQGSTIEMNSGNNVTLNTNNSFTINKTGRYEISGSINYNTAMSLSTSSDVEFIIQISTDNGATWTDAAKNTGVWGQGTGGNSRTLIIAPIVISLAKDNLIRGFVKSNYGTQGTAGTARIYSSTGMNYSRVLKIQYLN